MRYGARVVQILILPEAAHAMVNKEGKQLSLLAAILRGKRYDKRCYKTIDIHDKTGVPRTHQDKSEVKRMQISIKRKESHTRKYTKKRQEDSASENEETILSKTDHGKMLELDIEERKMRLREREIKARTAEAEARLIEAKAEELELENQRKKYDNEMSSFFFSIYICSFAIK
ncbi:9120_t:CDS:2 [Funneliformis caledonium]|uniref:9120_t:CDS:1 n=1 Tax=Funneliformis caledonium TaxID=1117310 RepID=A0A9N9E5X9_9GLOM|nr:9120_t:CDS:2 [Funneliformis caledonium]